MALIFQFTSCLVDFLSECYAYINGLLYTRYLAEYWVLLAGYLAGSRISEKAEYSAGHAVDFSYTKDRNLMPLGSTIVLLFIITNRKIEEIS